MKKTSSVGSVLVAMLFVGQAEAHIDLVSPTPRLSGQTGGSQLKTKPCGQTQNKRTTDKVTHFSPGQTVEIKIKEYVDHPSYLAVAFDPDGDDSFVFPRANMDKVDATTDDPKALFPVDGKTVLGLRTDKDKNCATENADKTCTLSITLPTTPCQNCTLQVTQFMYDKVNDNLDDEYYYQCADITIDAAGAGGSGTGGGSSAGSAGVGVAGTGGAPTTSGGAGGTGGTAGVLTGSGGAVASAGASLGGSLGNGSAGAAAAGSPSVMTAGSSGTSATSTPGTAAPDEAGCAVAKGRRGGASLWVGLGLLAVFARRRRGAGTR